jgi:hypothetical protein
VTDRLDADTLRWASRYIQHWAESIPREVLSGAGFAGMELAAVHLGAAASRVARGERPEPLSEFQGVAASQGSPEAVTPLVIDSLIVQLLALRREATAGEWTVRAHDKHFWEATEAYPLEHAVAEVVGGPPPVRTLLGMVDLKTMDAAYALAAANAVPLLIAEIRRLRALIE